MQGMQGGGKGGRGGGGEEHAGKTGGATGAGQGGAGKGGRDNTQKHTRAGGGERGPGGRETQGGWGGRRRGEHLGGDATGDSVNMHEALLAIYGQPKQGQTVVDGCTREGRVGRVACVYSQ